ncbi:hypothetical protein HPB49_011337 [Dermacentor silvarum]|uniref:Uncharacterized protein n=1 Tax=Dermacentor silvarum TaxID=543639 RepID=A0ACB8DZ61_DERSI|nr:hypothetical protein HPB49_011337 [Dermacentor silvarum]
MLLVMDTAGVFQAAAGEELENSSTGYTQLWTVTWDRIDSFLPRLKEEVFKPPPRPSTPPALPPAIPSEDAVLESNCSADQAIRTTGEEDSYELVSVMAGPVAAPVAPVPPPHSVILHPPSLSPPPVLPTAVPQTATPVPLVIDPIVFCEQHHSVFAPSQCGKITSRNSICGNGN